MGFPLTSNPNILGHDSLTHGSAHATNDVAWLGTWHAGVILKFGRMCSKGSDFSKGQIVKHSNWLFCNQHGCRFVLSCKAKCNEALIFIITMATQRTGLRWELQHNCDQMGPPLLCTHCSVVHTALWFRLRCNLGFRNQKRQPWVSRSCEEFPDHYSSPTKPYRSVPLAFGKHPRTQMNTSATNFVIDMSVWILFVILFILLSFRFGLIFLFRFLLLVIVLLGSPTHWLFRPPKVDIERSTSLPTPEVKITCFF